MTNVVSNLIWDIAMYLKVNSRLTIYFCSVLRTVSEIKVVTLYPGYALE